MEARADAELIADHENNDVTRFALAYGIDPKRLIAVTDTQWCSDVGASSPTRHNDELAPPYWVGCHRRSHRQQSKPG